MRRRRTIYFNDARHYYLFVFEPPMRLEDAWRPVDEVAGTAVDTFAYGVERGDGLFYPSRVGMRFGEDIRPFQQAAYWRVWHNMESLMDRGLDPLTVLIDRAHDKGMDFIASMRLGSYGGMEPSLSVSNGGRGFVNAELRRHQHAVLTELATEYSTDGVELDFAAAPGGSPFLLRDEDTAEYMPVLTDWVREVFTMVRGRRGAPGLVGARVYPTAQMCRAKGLDVPTWLEEGLVDYVVPMLYTDMLLDPDMPFEWLVEAAHAADVSVYGMLQPYVKSEKTNAPERAYPTPEMVRATAANYWERGVDGLYAWFMRWPLGDTQRRILTELGDPDLVRGGDKHYVLRRRTEQSAKLGYDAALPVELRAADGSRRGQVPFHIADDIEAAGDNVRQVRLRLYVRDLVSADRLTVLLNGVSLADEPCTRSFGDAIAPYVGQLLEFPLRTVRPRKGRNILEVSLDGRPADLASSVSVEEVEVRVEYGPYPARLG